MQEDSADYHAPSGIAALPSLAWGSHIGQLYGSAANLRDLIIPFFRAGLENNERCLWVTGTPLDADEARSALRAVVPDLDAREQSGQIEIQDTSAFYKQGEPLRPQALVAGLVQREQEALAAGYRGLRTNGNCAWVDKANWSGFLDYESGVDEAVHGRRLICMCSYQHDRIEAGQVRDVLERHGLVLHSPRPNSTEPGQLDGGAACTLPGTAAMHDAPHDAEEAGMRLAETEARLSDALALNALHHQSIAVLGHDLRNPLVAISAGATFLLRSKLDDKARAISEAIARSADHMAALIDDLSDMSRGRLGNGISLRLSREGLEPALRHAVEELRLAHPGRRIEVTLSLRHPVETDPVYMARLLSNLLKNALIYGSQTDPVEVNVSADTDFILSVSNKGPQIPHESQKLLFAPFTRGALAADQQGLGLGLYIVAEIARAHGGTIEVASTEDETRFSFRMPIR
jgi:signal transduction histidine kinase